MVEAKKPTDEVAEAGNIEQNEDPSTVSAAASNQQPAAVESS